MIYLVTIHDPLPGEPPIEINAFASQDDATLAFAAAREEFREVKVTMGQIDESDITILKEERN